ncbi:MAG: hypothetical protein ACJ72V_00825 [Nitrososphaeraceae archaeon]
MDNNNKLTASRKTTTTTTIRDYAIIAKLIQDCYEEENMDKKAQTLYSLLPKTCRIDIPSLITNDYIDTALYRIEEKVDGIIASV